jgi:hypothetical protein
MSQDMRAVDGRFDTGAAQRSTYDVGTLAIVPLPKRW